jgi:hypothetical protein
MTVASPTPSTRFAACALPIEISGVPTVPAVADVTLLGIPRGKAPLEVEAPRGSMPTGSAFSLRYSEGGKAMRAIARCMSIDPRHGMVDLCTVLVVAEPGEPKERVAARVDVKVELEATIVRSQRIQASPRVPLKVLNVSSTGLGFSTLRPLQVHDVIRLRAPGPRGLWIEADYQVLRAAEDRPGFYGAHALDPHAGNDVYNGVLRAWKRDQATRAA